MSLQPGGFACTRCASITLKGRRTLERVEGCIVLTEQVILGLQPWPFQKPHRTGPHSAGSHSRRDLSKMPVLLGPLGWPKWVPSWASLSYFPGCLAPGSVLLGHTWRSLHTRAASSQGGLHCSPQTAASEEHQQCHLFPGRKLGSRRSHQGRGHGHGACSSITPETLHVILSS